MSAAWLSGAALDFKSDNASLIMAVGRRLHQIRIAAQVAGD